tara:strand:- start:27769 stop:28275 length:507 start_codon:yes stop_codon:yes gene_type:complete
MRFIGTYNSKMIEMIKEYHAEAIRMMPEIADINIEVNLNSRMRSNGGTARWRHNTGEIALNYRLHRDNDMTQVKQTYLHELAHIVQRVRYGWGRNIKSHGVEWQRIMRGLGINPDRTHKMDVSAYKNKTTRIAYKCGCQVHNITKQRHNKILRGASYSCKSCKMKLTR